MLSVLRHAVLKPGTGAREWPPCFNARDVVGGAQTCSPARGFGFPAAWLERGTVQNLHAKIRSSQEYTLNQNLKVQIIPN